MKFDAHIEALRKGADGNLTMAKEARSNAAKHQKMADDFTAEAVRHEELAQGFDLLADALATGRLTTEQLRGIVNGMLSDDPTEAFVDAADAERYAQRDEYVNGTGGGEAAAVREIEREMAIEAGDDSELDRQIAEDDARFERSVWLANQAAKDAEAQDDAWSTAEQFEHDQADEFAQDARDDARNAADAAESGEAL